MRLALIFEAIAKLLLASTEFHQTRSLQHVENLVSAKRSLHTQ